MALIVVAWTLFPFSRHPDLTEIPDLSGLDPAVAALIGEFIADLNREPRDAERHARLGMAYQANNLRQAAAASYEQAVQLEPSEPKWWYFLALSRSLLGDVEGALTSLDEVTRRNGDYVPAYWRRGELLAAQGDWPAAEAAYRRALEVNPGEPAALVGVARVYLQREQSREAIDALEKLLERFPNHPYLHQLLGRAYRQAGEHERAKAAMAQSRPGEPQWPDPWVQELDQYRVGFSAEFKRALRLIGKGQADSAIGMLESLRERQPNDLTLLNNLGAAYINVGKYGDAVTTLEAALALEPSHFGVHLNLSSAYEKLGDLDAALRHAELAIGYNATLAASHMRHGVLLMGKSRFDEALAAFGTARQFDANDVQGLVFSGWIECRRKQWTAALPYFENALKQSPRVVPALSGLALARMELGRLAEALEALQAAERLNPNDKQCQAVRRRFERIRRNQP